MIVLVHGDGLTVQGDGGLEVPGLTGGVALSDLLQEERLVGLHPGAEAHHCLLALKQIFSLVQLKFLSLNSWLIFDKKKVAMIGCFLDSERYVGISCWNIPACSCSDKIPTLLLIIDNH